MRGSVMDLGDGGMRAAHGRDPARPPLEGRRTQDVRTSPHSAAPAATGRMDALGTVLGCSGGREVGWRSQRGRIMQGLGAHRERSGGVVDGLKAVDWRLSYDLQIENRSSPVRENTDHRGGTNLMS